jgi:NAD(P)-dependent dehydrogenase (short-subunit alcohol dehydrogenase family)
MSTPTSIVIGVGAERGLGAALCRRFAAGGYHVLVAGRTPEKIARVARTIGETSEIDAPVVAGIEDDEVGRVAPSRAAAPSRSRSTRQARMTSFVSSIGRCRRGRISGSTVAAQHRRQ